MGKSITIGNKHVGLDWPVFIVAELSCNHQGSFATALKTIEAIKEAGADAVKLSTDKNDGGITINCQNKYFQVRGGTPWDGQTLFALYEKAFTPWEWQPKLKEFAESLGLVCFSTATDKTAVDFICAMNMPAIKVASFEINDVDLISYIAATQRPVIISTGMASHQEITDALKICRDAGNDQIALLKAVSAYPAPLAEINLNTIPDMIKNFDVVVGLSDHSLATAVDVAAVALGARIIEKHFILDRKMGGPDAGFSAEPSEFKEMVRAIREVEAALGAVSYDIPPSAQKNKVFKRSLYVIKDIKAGEFFTPDNIRSIRPAYGLSPCLFNSIVGRQAAIDIKRGTPLSWDLMSEKQGKEYGKK